MHGTVLLLLLLVIYIFLVGLWGYWLCGHSCPIVPASGDSEDDCGEADGMLIGRGNRSSRRKPAPVPLCPPQTPYLPGRGWEPATNRLSYGTASAVCNLSCCRRALITASHPVSNIDVNINAQGVYVFKLNPSIKFFDQNYIYISYACVLHAQPISPAKFLSHL
jgi:hypothetical protein